MIGYLCFLVVWTSPPALATVLAVLDLRRVSSSSELKSFLSMCTAALESTTNSSSSGDYEVGDGIALASNGESNVDFFYFWSL